MVKMFGRIGAKQDEGHKIRREANGLSSLNDIKAKELLNQNNLLRSCLFARIESDVIRSAFQIR
jgi:hypothetical protein